MNVERLLQRIEDLHGDIYAQPEDSGHTAWGTSAILNLLPYAPGFRTVLDVGCGEGMFAPVFAKAGKTWSGVTLGPDFQTCFDAGLLVYSADMSDLPFPDRSYGLVFARHVLEHSPFPILTLMEWHRVAKRYLMLVAPAPAYWGWIGRNHYSICQEEQLVWWLARAGWAVKERQYLRSTDEQFLTHWRAAFGKAGDAAPKEGPEDMIVEYRFLCEKTAPRIA